MMLKAFLFFCSLVYLTSGQRLSPDPFFIEEPENVTIITGKKVILKCVIGNANGRSAQWTFDNFGLGLDRGLTDWPHLRMVGASPKSKSKLFTFPFNLTDFFWQFEFRTASQFFRFNWKVQLIKRSLCSTLETMVRCFCTFNVVLIVIPTMFPLCNFLAKDAILVVKPYVCFTTKIFDIFALWFISFLSISFSDVIVLRSIWSTWVTKDTIQGAKRVLITLSGGGWSRVHYLRNDPSCFLRPSSRSPREVFLLRGFLFFLIESWEWVEGMKERWKQAASQ